MNSSSLSAGVASDNNNSHLEWTRVNRIYLSQPHNAFAHLREGMTILYAEIKN